jgi:hypothetical protein
VHDGLGAGSQVDVVRGPGEVLVTIVEDGHLARSIETDAHATSSLVAQLEPADIRVATVFLGPNVRHVLLVDG